MRNHPPNFHRINFHTYHNLEKYSERPDLINQRVAELNSEWDLERSAVMVSSIISLCGMALGAFVHIYWLLLSVLVTFFLIQDVLLGQGPFHYLLEKMGRRTFIEIQSERHALKALRGDYSHVDSPADALEDSIRN